MKTTTVPLLITFFITSAAIDVSSYTVMFPYWYLGQSQAHQKGNETENALVIHN